MHSPDSIITTLENAPALIVPLVREVPPANLKRRPALHVWSVHEHACRLDHVYNVEELLLNPNWA